MVHSPQTNEQCRITLKGVIQDNKMFSKVSNCSCGRLF